METRRLGPSGPTLTRLGLGLAALGRPAYITLHHGEDFPGGRSPEAMQQHAFAVLDAAYAAGIRYFDAARSYGRAEAFLRSWLDARSLRPGQVVVGSKWGYRYVGNWQLRAERHEVKDHSLGALRAQRAESAQILGPHLALYQIHSATPESGVLDDGAVLDELARLRDGGLEIGVSVSGPEQAQTIRRALEIQRGGAPLFASVQATWNLLERACEPALEEAHARGLVVLVKEALANGRLTDRGAGSQGALAEIARRVGRSLDVVALAAALARPWADVVLLGASTVEQLQSNLAALDFAPSADLIHALDALAEPPHAYWSARAALPWT